MRLSKLLLFFSVLFYSMTSFADTYYYKYSSNSKKYSSVTEACIANWPAGTSYNFSHVQPWSTSSSNTTFTCIGAHITQGSYSGIIQVQRYGDSCPPNHTYDSLVGECLSPEPDPELEACEEGLETTTWLFFPKVGDYHVNNHKVEGCLPGSTPESSCSFTFSHYDGSYGPVEKNGQLGIMQNVVFVNSGEQCSTQGEESDLPNEDPPGEDVEENKDCQKFVNADGSWGFDCNPKPEPEDNQCPDGYMLQGDTCFRIPPDHPDYDESKDPQKPGQGEGGNNNQGGNEGGDSGTLDSIDSTLKGIDKTTKAIESATKTGNATTHDLLRDIKDAIGNIPGGGGGNQPGTGEGEGEGEGSGEGEAVEGCDSEDCGFGERDIFGEEGVPSFGETFTDIMDGISNSPIGQSIGAIQFPSGGTCPTASVTLDIMGGVIPLTFDSHCDLWEYIAPILSAVFMAFWALIAVRVFLSA